MGKRNKLYTGVYDSIFVKKIEKVVITIAIGVIDEIVREKLCYLQKEDVYDNISSAISWELISRSSVSQ